MCKSLSLRAKSFVVNIGLSAKKRYLSQFIDLSDVIYVFHEKIDCLSFISGVAQVEE